MKPKGQLQTAPLERVDLTKYLSGSRMNSYSDAVAVVESASFDEFDLYVYNMALAGAFLGPIHLLEVVTRNAMHQQMATHAGQPDWWNSPRIFLLQRQQEGITKAETQLKNQRQTITTSYGADDLVAALDFGFWCGLLGKGVSGDSAYDYERQLWQPVLRRAFPRFRGNRDQLCSKMDAARRLRNRVGHHEPIHTRNQKTDYANIFNLLAYVSNPIAQWMDDRSRLPSVAVRKPGNPDAICYF